MNGTVIVKEKSTIGLVQGGSKGTITTYDPEQNRFSVKFENGPWLVFTESEESFLDKFSSVEIKQEEKE